MGTVVNLRAARKAKARAERADAARDARLRHGRSGAQKRAATAEAAARNAHLDGHKREP
ncbi:MAG: DUF4169 family protein [Pseudomonadota bacterium]